MNKRTFILETLHAAQCAFTLAEVLITLGIIGVVASLTMPALIQSRNDKAAVVKVKKAYSVIANAVRLWQMEEGCDTDVADCLGSYTTFDCKNAFAGIESKLNIVDRRYQTEALTDVTWLPAVSYGLDGAANQNSWAGADKLTAGNYICRYLLNDGVTMSVHLPDDFNKSGTIFIDINGVKAPNRVGKDIFPVGIGSNGSSSKGVNPYFVQDSSSDHHGMCAYRSGNECSPDDGKSPTAYVLLHDKLPDLQSMGYPK
ncbi:MAG: type II secretion system GspH family protein [Heliobacteriaceae bacterium]|jgi:prepilin-type N-terminal cleavage/methylation domain-containing protein|nr:type II secretion system GspH family protein [Heliobacteriaceae bacterium]